MIALTQGLVVLSAHMHSFDVAALNISQACLGYTVLLAKAAKAGVDWGMDIHSDLIDRVLRFYVFQQALDCVCFFKDSTLGGGDSTKLPIIKGTKDKATSDAYGAFSAVCNDVSTQNTGNCCYMKLTDDLDLSGTSIVVGNLFVYLNNHTLTVDNIIADNIILMDGNVKATEVHASFLLALSHANVTASVDLFGSELVTDTAVPDKARCNYSSVEKSICPQFDSYVDKNLAKHNDVNHKEYQFPTTLIDALLASIKNELSANMSAYSAAHVRHTEATVVTSEMTAQEAIDLIVAQANKCATVSEFLALKLIPEPLPSVVAMAREVMLNKHELAPYESQLSQVINTNVRAVAQCVLLQALKLCGVCKGTNIDINPEHYKDVDDFCDYLFDRFLTTHDANDVFDCSIGGEQVDVFSMMEEVDKTKLSGVRIDQEQDSGKWSDSQILLAKYAIIRFFNERNRS